MKLIILSPNLHLIFSEEQKKFLEWEFDVEYFTVSAEIQSIDSLQSSEEKIVSIDPDFCSWKVTRDDIDFMRNVKAICLPTTAFHYIDTAYLQEKNIPVTNLRWFSTNAVAEQALAILFSLARKFPMIIRDWFQINFEKYRGIELSGKKVGIIWLGRIGKRIAELTQALGMQVSYWSKESRDTRFSYTSLESLLKDSDVVFYALAKNNETQDLLTDERIALLKVTSIVISIAHIDHVKFISLAESGKIWWYGCDDPIGKLEDFHSNIMPWAELWWCTSECFQRNGDQWIEAIMDAKNNEFKNQVN